MTGIGGFFFRADDPDALVEELARIHDPLKSMLGDLGMRENVLIPRHL